MESTDLPASIVCVGNAWFPATPGGLDRYVYELAYNLSKRRDVIELCGVGLPESAADFPVTLTNLADPDRSLWQRLRQTRTSYLDSRTRESHKRVDAINLHFALYSLPLMSLFPADVPTTFHFHGPWALESDKEGSSKLGVMVKRWIEQQVYQRCDRFIVLSKAFGQILHESYRVPWNKIHVIPGGVNTDWFQISCDRTQARTQLNWPQDRFILFTPRRLVHRMGLDNLLLALAEITEAVPEVWLAIAGKGPLRSQLEAQVERLGLANNVRFLGFLPEADLPMAYQAADLTVMPSQSLEGFGLVLLESLACGTPAICTPIGGMPEVLSGLSLDLITDTADTDSITQTLQRAIAGEISLPDRASCRSYAVANFSWPTIAQRVRDVLLMPVP
ncbi:glycosyltransferase family 4 protein [cf. Phormidesmis sp. LEGE 11477]|nr:glycosyltransferase family 4 protein [cf. Phormidesmis sp. LEGE 11477]